MKVINVLLDKLDNTHHYLLIVSTTIGVREWSTTRRFAKEPTLSEKIEAIGSMVLEVAEMAA